MEANAPSLAALIVSSVNPRPRKYWRHFAPWGVQIRSAARVASGDASSEGRPEGRASRDGSGPRSETSRSLGGEGFRPWILDAGTGPPLEPYLSSSHRIASGKVALFSFMTSVAASPSSPHPKHFHQRRPVATAKLGFLS